MEDKEKTQTHEHFAEIPEISIYHEKSKDSMTEHECRSVKLKARNEQDLLTFHELINKRNEITAVGLTCGAFDLLHAGHVEMLKECKTVCDYLIVGIQEDPSVDRDYKNKPIQTLEERITMVSSCRYVDEYFVYKTEKDLHKILKELDEKKAIDVRILGADWQFKKYTGWDLQIPVYFNKRDHKWSTSELRDRIFGVENEKRDRRNREKKQKVRKSN